MVFAGKLRSYFKRPKVWISRFKIVLSQIHENFEKTRSYFLQTHSALDIVVEKAVSQVK